MASHSFLPKFSSSSIETNNLPPRISLNLVLIGSDPVSNDNLSPITCFIKCSDKVDLPIP